MLTAPNPPLADVTPEPDVPQTPGPAGRVGGDPQTPGPAGRAQKSWAAIEAASVETGERARASWAAIDAENAEQARRHAPGGT